MPVLIAQRLREASMAQAVPALSANESSYIPKADTIIKKERPPWRACDKAGAPILYKKATIICSLSNRYNCELIFNQNKLFTSVAACDIIQIQPKSSR